MKKIFFNLLIVLVSVATSHAQDSLNMHLFSHLKPSTDVNYTDIWGYADANGREYAIIGGRLNTYFVNITQPTTPVIVNTFQHDASSIWRDYKTYRKYAYSSADQGTEGLRVYSLSSLPDSAHLVAQINTDFVRAHNIYIDTATARLYVLGASSNVTSFNIMVYNISNPALPVLETVATLPGGYIHDAFVRNDTVYASHGNNGFFIYKYNRTTNKSFTKLDAKTTFYGYNHSSWVSNDGRYAVFATETHGTPLRVVDVSNLNNDDDLDTISSFKSNLELSDANSIVHNPFIKGNLVIMSYYFDGVQIFDMSNPAHVVRVGSYDTYPQNNGNGYGSYDGCWGVYPYLPSGNIIASDISNGLFVLKYSPASSSVVENNFSYKITIFPNPSDGKIVRAALPTELLQIENLTLEIFSNTGVLCFQTKKNLENANLELEIPQALSNGLYHLTVRKGEQIFCTESFSVSK